MRLLTWNVCHRTGRSDLIGALADLVNQTGAEAVCLQEVDFTRFWLRAAARRLDMRVCAAMHPRLYGPWIEGLAILSRYPVISRQTARLSPRRSYLQVCLATPGLGALRVGCIHASTAHWRESEIINALKLLPGRSAVLAGDFNLTPGNAAIWAAGDQLEGDGCREPTCGDRKIDYIFATPDLRLNDCQTAAAGVSDHSGLAASLAPAGGRQ